MPTRRRKRAQKREKTDSPSVKHKIVESERLSSHSDEFSSPETKTASQEAAEPERENRSEDSNSVDSPSYGFKKPETEAPSQEAEKCENPKRAGPPSFELKALESKTLSEKSQTRSLPHKVEEFGDSGKIGSPSCHFKKPKTNILSHKSQTTSPSHNAEECLDLRRIDSPSFEFKKSKTRMQYLKGGKRGDSTREGSPLLEVKKQGNKASSEQSQDYHDLEMVDTLQYQFTDPHLKECDSSEQDSSSVKLHKAGVSFQKEENSDDASRRYSRLREFKRLKQRDLELDNERAALTEAIGNETGLTAIMQQLHKYNLIKDTTQLIIGSLSNVLNVPVAQLHQELNLNFQK
jgi:hypothetical protein